VSIIRVFRIGPYKSKVPFQLLLKCLEEAGTVIEDVYHAGGRARLPGGSKIYFWPDHEDGGIGYSLSNHELHEHEYEKAIEDIKFIQRVFAKANLLLSQSQKAQATELSEIEEKEERKKNTSEVSEFVSGTSDSVHGGDSASGEVPGAESGRGRESHSSAHALSLLEAGSEEGECANPSDAPGLSPDLPSKEGGESCAADSSELRSASEWEGSSGDGACPKSLECASQLKKGGDDAPMDGQASIGEGTGSLASSPEDVLEDILREEEPGESSTLPSPSGANEGEAPEPAGEESPSFSYKDFMKKRKFKNPLPHHSKDDYSFGGVYADLASQHGVLPREFINRARRAFARLVFEYGEGEEGPRWDYRKVSTRIASYQNWRVSDRKKETGRPAIAVLPDVSGSMSSFADQVIELSKALMVLGVPGAEVVVIVQSNGYPVELWVNGKKIENLDDYAWDEYNYKEEVYMWYKNVFRRWNVKAIVIAADWDGEWLYWRIAENENVKIYWLDVYLSSKVYPTLSRQVFEKFVRDTWSCQAKKKVKYVYGCRDVIDFVKGLELAIRYDSEK
jgi:hypothetical protein